MQRGRVPGGPVAPPIMLWRVVSSDATMSPVYLDHAATTPLEPAVFEAMQPFFTERFGNPSSVHAQGRAARFAVEDARERVAAVFGRDPGEVVFMSGGTEANNAAISGTLTAEGARGSGLVTGAVEHDSVLRPARARAASGNPVHVVPAGPTGLVDVDAIIDRIDDATGLVSLMWVNNEVGSVQPVREVVEACRERGVPLHTDAVQAVAYFPEAIREVAPDLISVSAHKFGGPKGIGALVISPSTPFEPHLRGGSQERRRRAGTENVPAIVGLVTALEMAVARAAAERRRLDSLRARLARGVEERFPGRVIINTPEGRDAAPHILSVSFTSTGDPRLDGEMLLLGLDLEGVMVSSGSACASGAVEPSHVLQAIGLERAAASATVRFSMGRTTSEADVDRALAALVAVLDRQRAYAG